MSLISRGKLGTGKRRTRRHHGDASWGVAVHSTVPLGLPTPRDGNKGRMRDRLAAEASLPRRRPVGHRRAWHGTVELVAMGQGDLT